MNWKDFRIQKRLQLDPAKIEEIYQLISQIDIAKATWKSTRLIPPVTLQRLTRSVIITSTGASNRIEGNRLTDEQVEELYKNLHIKKFKTRDEQEIAGYLECLEYIVEHFAEFNIDEHDISKLHNQMLHHSTKDISHKGKYKSGSNRVEAKDQSGNLIGIIFDPTPPYLVQKEMHDLIAWYTWAIQSDEKHPLILIANFIFEFLAIHPFQDGNGRTSRLLTNIMLLQEEYVFARVVSHEKIIEEHKADYYLALNKTQSSWKTEKENITPWLLFFLNVVNEQAKRATEILNSDSIEYVLSKQQLIVWNWINQGNYEFSRKSIIEGTNLPARTVEESIKKLFSLKKIQKLGAGQATRYKLIK